MLSPSQILLVQAFTVPHNYSMKWGLPWVPQPSFFGGEQRKSHKGGIYLPSAVVKWSQATLRGTQGKEKRQWAETAAREIFISYKEKNITRRVTEHWNRLPRVVSCPSLGTVKTKLLRSLLTWIFGQFYNWKIPHRTEYGCFHCVPSAVRKGTFVHSCASIRSSSGPACSFPLIFFLPSPPTTHQAAKDYLEEDIEKVLVVSWECGNEKDEWDFPLAE